MAAGARAVALGRAVLVAVLPLDRRRRPGVVEQHGLRYDTSFDESEDYDLWTRLLAGRRRRQRRRGARPLPQARRAGVDSAVRSCSSNARRPCGPRQIEAMAPQLAGGRRARVALRVPPRARCREVERGAERLRSSCAPSEHRGLRARRARAGTAHAARTAARRAGSSGARSGHGSRAVRSPSIPRCRCTSPSAVRDARWRIDGRRRSRARRSVRRRPAIVRCAWRSSCPSPPRTGRGCSTASRSCRRVTAARRRVVRLPGHSSGGPTRATNQQCSSVLPSRSIASCRSESRGARPSAVRRGPSGWPRRGAGLARRTHPSA